MCVNTCATYHMYAISNTYYVYMNKVGHLKVSIVCTHFYLLPEAAHLDNREIANQPGYLALTYHIRSTRMNNNICGILFTYLCAQVHHSHQVVWAADHALSSTHT